MNITVKIDEVSLTTTVEQAMAYDDESGPYVAGERTVGHLVAEMIVDRLVQDRDRWHELRSTVTEIKREVIREAVLPQVEQAISAPIQKTSAYGDPIGEPVTLREVIVDEARKLVNTPTDRYDSHSGTLLSKIVAEQVREAFANEVRDQVKQARDSVADEIGKQVASAVAAGMRTR